LSRMHKLIKVRAGFWWCSLMVAAVLVMPRLSSELWVNGIYESASILILFPLIVSMGAGSSVTGKSVKYCKFLGEISYPLYITHYPLIYMQMSWAAAHPNAPLGTVICVSASIFLLAIGIAYSSLKLYDLPVRDWLKKHWLMKDAIVKAN
jgi:peptidoglycan/LPS O-acetylase OafA/YrhL